MSAIERDGKRWTVADIDQLERERDDYKDRWETLGRVSKRVIDRLEGAVDRVIADDEAMRRARHAYLNSPPHGTTHDEAARLEHMRAAFRAAFKGQ